MPDAVCGVGAVQEGEPISHVLPKTDTAQFFSPLSLQLPPMPGSTPGFVSPSSTPPPGPVVTAPVLRGVLPRQTGIDRVLADARTNIRHVVVFMQAVTRPLSRLE